MGREAHDLVVCFCGMEHEASAECDPECAQKVAELAQKIAEAHDPERMADPEYEPAGADDLERIQTEASIEIAQIASVRAALRAKQSPPRPACSRRSRPRPRGAGRPARRRSTSRTTRGDPDLGDEPPGHPRGPEGRPIELQDSPRRRRHAWRRENGARAATVARAAPCERPGANDTWARTPKPGSARGSLRASLSYPNARVAPNLNRRFVAIERRP
jgi:hypothetical protein